MKDKQTNNWQEIAEELFEKIDTDGYTPIGDMRDEIKNTILQAMGLVFESTKQKCAEEAEIKFSHNTIRTNTPIYNINKPSILNIDKPNLKLDE